MRSNTTKIFLAGHNGMVGSAILRALREKNYENIITRDRKELDLTEQKLVANFLAEELPEYIINAAGRVGGIRANNSFPASFIYDNLMINCNLIEGGYKAGVRDAIFLGSSCIYPKNSPQPIKEEYLLSSDLEKTNEPYAVAKIAAIKLCQSYNKQFELRYCSVMPCNLYGPNDNFNLETSHVLPAILRKVHEAKVNAYKSVEIWGSGQPMREFLHVDDLAAACVHIMEIDYDLYTEKVESEVGHVNVGTGREIRVAELVDLIIDVVGYKGNVTYNQKLPDGTARKVLDTERINQLGWQARIDLECGLESTYKWFLDNYNTIRV